MKYLMESGSEGTVEFAKNGENAVNLRGFDPMVGTHLSAVIRNSLLTESMAKKIDNLESMPSASIKSAPEIANIGSIISMALERTEHAKEGGDATSEHWFSIQIFNGDVSNETSLKSSFLREVGSEAVTALLQKQTRFSFDQDCSYA